MIESINNCTEAFESHNELGLDETPSSYDNDPADGQEMAPWQENDFMDVDSDEGSAEEADIGRGLLQAIADGFEEPPFDDEPNPQTVWDEGPGLLGVEKSDGESYNLTDAGNGRRLVDKHQDDIRYCPDDKDWYVWDGVSWRKDVVKNIRELAKGIAADIRSEAETINAPKRTGSPAHDKEARAEYESRKGHLLKWASQSENADGVTKTIRSAESDPKIICFKSEFDQDANLLNCVNGVVDLRTGTLMPHDRKLMMSNLCPLEFDPSGTHPVWQQSLEAFTRKHPDLPPFLKSIAGYSIQGAKTEERIIVLHGHGNCGKGTFMDWMTYALGPDYACAMDASSVLKQKRNSAAASGDIARLQGKRLVVVSEIEKGSRLQESFMKQASGNDSLVARSMYKSEREFRPTHQFWFQTNFRPGFDSTDSGNKRRYMEIPFDNDLSADPQVKFDSKLKLRMRQDKDFLKAVLAWTIAGAVEWHQHGLQIPESVKAATAALFAHNDFLSRFLRERCVVGPREKEFRKDVAEAYKCWCEDEGENPALGRTFNHMMEERGFERRQARIHGLNDPAWIGIRLKENDELLAAACDAEAPEDIDVPATKSDENSSREVQDTRRLSIQGGAASSVSTSERKLRATVARDRWLAAEADTYEKESARRDLLRIGLGNILEDYGRE